ncbi:MAG: putative glycoside hydrolase family 15 protein [Deltaproteobacteria bacterium]|nr:putative glycoside hydrolase family 15 protein [Deltaproteobacteria bacterium]
MKSLILGFIVIFGSVFNFFCCQCDQENLGDEQSDIIFNRDGSTSDAILDYDAGLGERHNTFVYSALVLYGRFGPTYPDDCFPLSVAGKFDLFETGPDNFSTTRWCEVRENRNLNAFEELKRINPKIKIYLYRMGPGQYIVSKYDKWSQEDWEWIKENHGKDNFDRWIAVGVKTKEYLRSVPYPVERAMILGNKNWQQYWIEYNYKRIWGEPFGGFDGRWADGIFLDGMQYGVSWQNNWRPESSFDESTWTWISTEIDHPDAYYDTSTQKYRNDLWQKHYDEFLRKAVDYFYSKGVHLGLNSWVIYYDSQIALYEDLKILVMEECGFLCWKVLPVDQWEKRVKTMQSADNYTILSVNMPPGAASPNNSGPAPNEGLQRMDRIYEGRTGWQWLWFSMSSYLLAYNPDKPNAYFLFSLWEFRDQYWFEEYDPKLLNLGKPKGSAIRTENGIWYREFEKGFVAVNPYKEEKTLKIEKGPKVRILNHENFKTPENAPVGDLKAGITLETYHGAILLSN